MLDVDLLIKLIQAGILLVLLVEMTKKHRKPPNQ
jgi:hypothetical protein